MKRIRGASKHLQKSIEAIGRAEIKVGFFEHSQHETDKGTVPTASIAAVHELGSIKRNIPARPFLNPALEEKRDENVRLMLDAAKDALNGGSISANLEKIGGKMVGDVQTKITEITNPPLKKATIAARNRRLSKPVKGKKLENAIETGTGIAKPLIDSHQMYEAVNFEVTE